MRWTSIELKSHFNPLLQGTDGGYHFLKFGRFLAVAILMQLTLSGHWSQDCYQNGAGHDFLPAYLLLTDLNELKMSRSLAALLLKVIVMTRRSGTLLFRNQRTYFRTASVALPSQKLYTKIMSTYSALEYIRGIL